MGARAGRQLMDTEGVEQLVVVDRESSRATDLARALGDRATAETSWEAALGNVRAVAVAAPGPVSIAIVRTALVAGCNVVSTADDDEVVAGLLGLDAEARAAGVTIVAGAAVVPGLAEVLAVHAASSLDSTDEVQVARIGSAGPACVSALRRAHRDRPLEWRDGEWRSDRHRGSQLVWFPAPVGAHECAVVGSGAALMRDAVPGVREVIVRAGAAPQRKWWSALLDRGDPVEGWGAARVEVWGWQGNIREAVVYGIVERPAIAAGTGLAVATARLGGLIPEVELVDGSPGVRGLGALVEPVSFLAELARRGVKAAAFEGAVS